MVSSLASQQIGVRLSQARLAARLSVRALAAKVGVGHTTISYIEQGRHEPSVVLAERLAQALGLPPAWLAFGIGAAPSGGAVSQDPILGMFEAIRQNQAQGEKAIHKPLLLLLALSRLRRGEARLVRFDEIEAPLRSLMAQFCTGTPRPEYPFWHLRMDQGLWELRGEEELNTSTSPGVKQLREAGVQGGFREPVHKALVADAALQEKAAALLLVNSFPDQAQRDRVRKAAGL